MITEPSSYSQTCTNSKWVEAIETEMVALEHNKTWVITDLPAGKHAIGCKWVYKVKYLPDGNVERFKARWVAKGYN